MERLESLPFKGQKQLFEKLERLAKVVNLNKKERDEYEESLKIYRDNQNVLDYAIEKGRKEGWDKGKTRTQHLIATKMKESGLDTDSIIRFTGLSREEIDTL